MLAFGKWIICIDLQAQVEVCACPCRHMLCVKQRSKPKCSSVPSLLTNGPDCTRTQYLPRRPTRWRRLQQTPWHYSHTTKSKLTTIYCCYTGSKYNTYKRSLCIMKYNKRLVENKILILLHIVTKINVKSW